MGIEDFSQALKQETNFLLIASICYFAELERESIQITMHRAIGVH